MNKSVLVSELGRFSLNLDQNIHILLHIIIVSMLVLVKFLQGLKVKGNIFIGKASIFLSAFSYLCDLW